jgi:hypothetical protein
MQRRHRASDALSPDITVSAMDSIDEDEWMDWGKRVAVTQNAMIHCTMPRAGLSAGTGSSVIMHAAGYLKNQAVHKSRQVRG